MVYRPIDPNKFNGTVIVEWLNVSGGVDANPDWTQTHNELVRDGFAWVGVSAQVVGLNQLKCPTTPPPPPDACTCSRRSGPLRDARLIPADSYSYDIFSQGGQAIRDNPEILGGLTPDKLIAVGESQSAGRMVTYINAVHPLVHVYDGFLVHSRGAGGAALSQSPLPAVPAPIPTLIRTDLDVPVFAFQTESDVAGGFAARQPDTDLFRLWEAAGTSHFDHYGLSIGPSDIGDGQGAVANLEAMQHPTTSPGPGAECTLPINTGGAHWLLNSAIYWLNQWVTNGTPPPSAPVAADRVNVAVRLRQGRQRQHARWRANAARRRADRGARGFRQLRRTRKHESHLAVLQALRLDRAIPAGAAGSPLQEPRPVRLGVGSGNQESRERRVPAQG